jgi:hypothetical protein
MPQLRPNLHNLVRTTSSSPVLRLAPNWPKQRGRHSAAPDQVALEARSSATKLTYALMAARLCVAFLAVV